MSIMSMEGEHDDRVYAALLAAGDTGLSLRELEDATGLRYRVLHNVTWRLEQRGRARRVSGARPLRYVATRGVSAQSRVAPPEAQAPDIGLRPGRPAGADVSSARTSWRPHPDGEARRLSAVRLAEAVLAAEGLTAGHRREALSLATWFYTEADGKWNTRYRSVAAVGAPRTELNHEHVVTRKTLVDRLVAYPQSCERTMQDAVACCVLRDEHRQLTALDGASRSLTGWQRYAAAGIEVIDLATGETLDFESHDV